jgi:SWI/SNF-related matrix-associated actin-dependent regulator 1 of chromatin subfamily A
MHFENQPIRRDLRGCVEVRRRSDGSICVRLRRYSPENLQALKSIPGRRWDDQERCWVYPASQADFLRRYLYLDVPRLQVPTAAASHPLWERLYPYQRQNVEFAVEHRRCLIADEMGLGKSLSALMTVEATGCLPCLVVCPASLKANWRREILQWIPEAEVEILATTKPYQWSTSARYIICNYDILAHWVPQLEGKFRAIIFDESHALKNRSAKRTKAAKQIAQGVPVVLMLSGTPVLNRPVEIAEPLEILGYMKPVFGGWWKFVHRYCAAKKTRFGLDVSGASNTLELHRKLTSTCMIRHLRREVQKEIPSSRRVTVLLSPQDITRYRMAESEFISGLRSGRPLRYAEQVAYIAKMRLEAARDKLPAVIEWVQNALQQTDDKILLFAWHREIQDALAQAFSRDGLQLHADLTVEERQRVVEEFNRDPFRRVLVASLAVGSFGFNITGASQVVFAELGWTPALHEQAESRAVRIGQTRQVTAWYLLAEATIDEDMAEILDRKRVIVGAVHDSIEKELLDRLKQKYLQILGKEAEDATTRDPSGAESVSHS